MLTTEALKSIGLEEKEIKTYLALLELGESTVMAIAKKSGIKRPTSYLILRSLGEKGFVSRVSRGKKTFFIPQHPRKILVEAELQINELKEVMPQLESLLQRIPGKPRIIIYEGKDALDRAYDEMFVVKGEALFVYTIKLSMELFPKTFRKFAYAPFSPEFTMREIVDDSEEGRKYASGIKNPYRTVRLLPAAPFEIDLGIFGNRVLITSVKKEYFTVCIESEEISQAFRKIFELVWQAAKE